MTLQQHRNYRDGQAHCARDVHDATLGFERHRIDHMQRVAQSMATAAEVDRHRNGARARDAATSYYARGYVDEAIMLACLLQLRTERERDAARASFAAGTFVPRVIVAGDPINAALGVDDRSTYNGAPIDAKVTVRHESVAPRIDANTYFQGIHAARNVQIAAIMSNNPFNGQVFYTTDTGAIYMPLPESAWGGTPDCACKVCKAEPGRRPWDTLVIPGTNDRQPYTFTIHMPELHEGTHFAPPAWLTRGRRDYK